MIRTQVTPGGGGARAYSSDRATAAIRPVDPAEQAALSDFFAALSVESRYRRFFAPVRPTDGLLDLLAGRPANVDAIVAVADGVIVGHAMAADLRAAVVTERRFDRQLIVLSFPPRTEPFVRLLYRVNQARAALTSTAAGVTSLRELRGYAKRLDAANEPVEAAVRVIRGQLGLPPPDTS